MPLDVDHEIRRMQQMDVQQLLQLHRDVFGRSCSSRHKRHLIRTIAWGLQAREESGLSERALRRAAQLVDQAELHVAAATGQGERNGCSPAARRPVLLPGTILSRPYKGRTLEVTVLEEGFQYQDQVFGSLSALAKAITGSHWNGYRFFGLTNRRNRQ